MKLTIKSLNLENFKGIKSKTIEFGDQTLIKGINGSGKTTCADAFYFLFTGRNTALVNNPVITPIGAEECVSRVEAVIEIDGKECTVAKSQKFKSKVDDDGNRTTSTSNTYEINSVEKSERDFISDLWNRGVDMDRFLTFSNPDHFMADTSKKGRELLRATLFEMADDVSDKDIAKEIGATEVETLLENYTLNEIESMNKATIRKIVEANGKNGEIIDGKISGIIASKVDVDVKSLEKTKAEYESELESVREIFANLTKGDNEIKGKIAQYEGDLIEIEKNERISIEEKIAKASQKLRKAEEDKRLAENDEYMARMDEQTNSEELRRYKESLDNYRNLYKEVQSEKLDENSTKCPSCGREYPKEQIAQMKKDFEDGKAKRLSEYKAKGEEFAKKVEETQKKCDESRAKYEKANAKWKAADSKVDKYGTELASISRNPDLTKNEKYVQIRSEIDNLKDELLKKGDLKLQELSNRESYLITMIKQVIGDLAVADRNKDLDEQIKQLRQEKKDAEINKAKAEKVIFEVDKVKRAKNEKLSESINNHFKIVDFKLFDFRKNGEYVDTIDMLIDGKPASTCANGSLLTLAKLDCINGLQNFFNQHLPVWVDDAALITTNTKDRINLDTQVIQLIAANDVKELSIEKEK